jgi:hypothetical protein
MLMAKWRRQPKQSVIIQIKAASLAAMNLVVGAEKTT